VEAFVSQALEWVTHTYHAFASFTAIDSDSIRRLAADYGHYIYALIFLWTFFEGETCVIIAGVVASQDYLEWTPLFLVAWFGSFAGDQLYFWIGRRWGTRLLDRIPRWRPGVAIALDFLRRYNTAFILSFRFVYGVRNFASFAMGMSGLDPLRFATLNFIAAFVWALSFAGFGYLFGEALEPYLDNVVLISLAVMATFFVGAYCLVSFLRHRHRREAERLAAATAAAAASSSSSTAG